MLPNYIFSNANNTGKLTFFVAYLLERNWYSLEVSSQFSTAPVKRQSFLSCEFIVKWEILFFKRGTFDKFDEGLSRYAISYVFKLILLLFQVFLWVILKLLFNGNPVLPLSHFFHRLVIFNHRFYTRVTWLQGITV